MYSNASSPTFFELYSCGKALPEEIDDFIDQWHAQMQGKTGKQLIPIHIFLGLSEDEYAVWVQDPNILPLILNARNEHTPLKQAIKQRVDNLIAARAGNHASLIALRNWLKDRKRA